MLTQTPTDNELRSAKKSFSLFFCSPWIMYSLMKREHPVNIRSLCFNTGWSWFFKRNQLFKTFHAFLEKKTGRLTQNSNHSSFTIVLRILPQNIVYLHFIWYTDNKRVIGLLKCVSRIYIKVKYVSRRSGVHGQIYLNTYEIGKD